MKRWLIKKWLMMALMVATTPVFAQIQFPSLEGHVVDDAAILPPETRDILERQLVFYQQETGIHILVMTTPSLNGRTLDVYAFQLARAWGMDEDKTDAIIFLVIPQERQSYIVPSQSLKTTITPEIMAYILDEKVDPLFKSGRFALGIREGINLLSAVAEGQDVREVEGQEVQDFDFKVFMRVALPIFDGVLLVLALFLIYQLMKYHQYRRDVVVYGTREAEKRHKARKNPLFWFSPPHAISDDRLSPSVFKKIDMQGGGAKGNW